MSCSKNVARILTIISFTTVLYKSVSSFNPNNQPGYISTVRNYRNFDELRNPNLHPGRYHHSHYYPQQGVHQQYHHHPSQPPPQYNHPTNYGNFQTFSIPKSEVLHSIPVSMSMSLAGSSSIPQSHHLPPSPASSSLNSHRHHQVPQNHNIRLLHQNPKYLVPIPPPQPRILNTGLNPTIHKHEEDENENAGTKYLELNLYSNRDDGDFGMRQEVKGKGSTGFLQENNNKGPFYPSAGSLYGSRAARRGIVENDRDELPFLTSTFNNKKKNKEPQLNKVDFFGGRLDSRLKTSDFVASPQVKSLSLDNNDFDGNNNNKLENGNNNKNDDGWVGLDGPGSLGRVTESGIRAQFLRSTTTPASTTTKGMTTITTTKTTPKPGNDVRRSNLKDVKIQKAIKNSKESTRMPNFQYQTTKLTKTNGNNQTSKSSSSSKKKTKLPSALSKSGYSTIRNGTEDPNLQITHKPSIIPINSAIPLIVQVNSSKVNSTTNSPNSTLPPQIPEKTVSASKMPGVPTTDYERGHKVVRNSRKPEMSTSTESLIQFLNGGISNSLSAKTVIIPISEATSNPFISSPQVQNNYKHTISDASSSSPPQFQTSSQFNEPKPSPEQIIQFTPNDVRPSFNPNSIFPTDSKPQETRNFNFGPTKSVLPTFSPHIPAQTPASLFSTSIPIVNMNRMSNSYPHTSNYNPARMQPRPKSLSHFHHPQPYHPHRQPRHQGRRIPISYPSPQPHPYRQHRPRRMTLPQQVPSQPSQFSSRSLDTGTEARARGSSNKKIVKKSSAPSLSPLGDGWLPFNFGNFRNDGQEDDSEEELNGGSNLVTDRNGHPIVDPQHPVVQNALNPLGNPAREPDQLIKYGKHTKILDPSSLVPLDKKLVIIGIMVGWMVIFCGLFSYKAWGNKGARTGWDDQSDDFGVSKPLLLNIPKDGTDPFLGTSRAMDVSGPNWGMNFVKVLDYIDIARKNYEGFDWQNLDCQKRILCELSQERSPTGETGRKLTNNYLLRFVDILDGLPIPQVIQAYLTEYKEAITEGKNTKKTCGEIYSKCKFSLTKLVENIKNKKE